MGNSSSQHDRHAQQQHQPYAPPPVYNRQAPYYPGGAYYGAAPPPLGPQPHHAQYTQTPGAQQYQQYQQHPQFGAYPHQAPAPKTQDLQRTDTIRNQVNLKKPTLQLIKSEGSDVWQVHFRFDASAACRITTFVHATEETSRACKIVTLAPPAPAVYASKGLDQAFPSGSDASNQHCIDPKVHKLDELTRLGPGQASTAGAQPASTYALLIRLEALTDEGRAAQRSLESLEPGCELPDWVQAQTTYVKVIQETHGDLSLRILKQKIWYKGDSYELQEIYGMERGAKVMGTPVDATPAAGEAFEDVEGNECVICMSAPRDTAALPCRHMCMCHQCAGALKTQTNKCPICRNEIRKLLHIKINNASQPAAEAAGPSPATPTPA